MSNLSEKEVTHPTDYVLVVCDMSFAALAAVNLVAAQIDVVGKTHGA